MNISAKTLDFKELNEEIRAAKQDVVINDCCGHRFICSGVSCGNITINGTPGNALGSYLKDGVITVNGNVQDAVGDTMNGGTIAIHGNAGDALGYSMRGGKIFVKGDVGYRAGIHIKEYEHKRPVIVIGGKAGSFLGEYLAGGLIIVLGLGSEKTPVGGFTGTGMHGGSIFIRTTEEPPNLPKQVTSTIAEKDNLEEIREYITEFAEYFGGNADAIINDNFYMLKPNAKNPYKQLYTMN
ncbi:MAG: glutamate synthase [Oscillospiraceae bacterium]|nr:glutamate synthase [Oscillospiraceae bacterium]